MTTFLVPVLHYSPDDQEQNRRRPSKRKRSGWAIPLPPRGKAVVIGRKELLACYYSHCGCTSNDVSTQGRCGCCQKVHWATTALSRQMLRIAHTVPATGSSGKNDTANQNTFVVAYRGRCATVMVTAASKLAPHSILESNNVLFSTASAKGSGDWRGHQVLTPGTRISFHSNKGIYDRLEYELVDCHCKDAGATLLHIVPFGVDLPQERVKLLKESLQQRQKLSVCDNVWHATHWIISSHLKDLEQLASLLEQDQDQLRVHLDQKRVQCLLPSWLPRCPDLPTPTDYWLGYCSRSRTPTSSTSSSSSIWKTKSTRPPRDPPRTILPKRRNNEAVARQFVRLSKAYEEAPLFPEEEWKALQFHKLAGRLQSLDVEITADNYGEVKPLLKEIPGLGQSALGMIHEVLTRGKIGRVARMEQDPTRIAIGNLMKIHGIGKAKAMALSQLGYRDIADIRSAMHEGTLSLSYEERIGVQCYEDLLDSIPRQEVEQIGKLVIEAFQSVSESAGEATIMGSFRRGKTSSGDVDVLITLPAYDHSVPPNTLSDLVRLLDRKGHIAFHITRVSDIGDAHLSDHEERHQPKPLPKPLIVGKNPCHSKLQFRNPRVSYMGVFYSPTANRKYRRVDIKIYAHHQRAFAFLYFTGGKWFNRSMRLWATQKFNWKLGDKGLVDINTGESVLESATSEEQIFRKLKLRYKAPAERTYFDDVEPL